jgi:hypothetical protein
MQDSQADKPKRTRRQPVPGRKPGRPRKPVDINPVEREPIERSPGLAVRQSGRRPPLLPHLQTKGIGGNGINQ